MANFLIKTDVLADYILSRFSPALQFVHSTGDGDTTNEQFQFYRLTTAPYAATDPGYAIAAAASGGLLVAADDYGMGQERQISETTTEVNDLHHFAIQSNGQDTDGEMQIRLLVGLGTPTGPATFSNGPDYPYVALEAPPAIPYDQGFLRIAPVDHVNAPQVTASGQNGNITISGRQLPPGQYGVTYIGLQNLADLYTTQGLVGPHYFGLETVGDDGVLPPILDLVQASMDDPSVNITVVLERVITVQLANGVQVDRVIEAMTMLPATAFKH